MTTCREMILLLDLCLPHKFQKEYEDIFIETITLSDFGLLNQQQADKIKSIYKVWFGKDSEKAPKIKLFKINSYPSFDFPSKFEIEMGPKTYLNKNIIHLFATKWFRISGSIPGTLMNVSQSTTPQINELKPKYSLTKSWNVHHGDISFKNNKILFSIIHTPFVEYFVKKMTILLETGQIQTLYDLTNHKDTIKMRLVSLINAGRILYEILNPHTDHCINEHYFVKSNRFAKYIYLKTEINLTLTN